MRRIALLATILAFVPAGAESQHRDPAPLSREISDRLFREPVARRGDPLPVALDRRLKDSARVLDIRDRRAPAAGVETDEADSAGRRMQLEGAATQFEVLRGEVRIRLSATRQRLVALGLEEKVQAWDAQVAQVDRRFDEIRTALQAVRTARTPAEREAARRRAAALLHRSLATARLGQAEPQRAPDFFRVSREVHKLREAPPAPDRLPRYLTERPAPAVGPFSSLENLVLAAAPVTPPEAASCTYTSADLAATPDVQLSTEIQALAEKLGYSPARIFEYVRNEIRFELYLGSLKGALGTLKAKSGNATDHASLLVALLRASNVPSRYVSGLPTFTDDARLLRWLGVKDYTAAHAALQSGGIGSELQQGGGSSTLRFNHVWVEACIPYGRYRGGRIDNTGHRWIPLDPSFKEKFYQAGITTSVAFDFDGYLTARTDRLPFEIFEDQVEAAIKSVGPNFSNNTLEDVAYLGKLEPRRFDILPASLPYYVYSFVNWSGGINSPETAALPDSHRYKLSVTVKRNSDSAQLLSTVLSFPALALQRLTLTYAPATPADQMIWDDWAGDLRNLPAGVVNVKPALKVDGIDVVVGGATSTLGAANTLILKLTLADQQATTPPCVGDSGSGTDPDLTCNNKAVYTNIVSGGHHALQAYAFQASDEVLSERAEKLLLTVRNSSSPSTPPPYSNDETTGEFLHVALLKYLRYFSDSSARIASLDGTLFVPGKHIGLTSSNLKVQFLFDLPFAVFPGNLYIDVKGARGNPLELTGGVTKWNTGRLIAHNASAYEHYIWQETARLEAVSTVRGLQFAQENSIPIIIFNSANIANYDTLMDVSGNPSTDMSGVRTEIQGLVAEGATVKVPRQKITYTVPGQTPQWNGAVYLAENQTTGRIIAAIGGAFSGGIAFFDTFGIDDLYTFGPEVPSVVRQTDCNLLSLARALATLARMSEARAVQMNGLGLRL
jgi:transglutaminase-like putative cysteine protease